MLFITAHIIDTVEDNDKLMQGKRATMEDFNRQGDKEFSKGSFTDTGRSIQLKNDIEGLTPEEAKKTQRQRDKEKADREKEAKRLEKERQKALKKAEKEKNSAKEVKENNQLLTPVAVDGSVEENNKQEGNNNSEVITIEPANQENQGE